MAWKLPTVDPAYRNPLRVVHGVSAVVFVLFALLQLNDPDPLPWLLVYGMTAVTAGVGAAGITVPSSRWGLVAVALVWGFFLATTIEQFSLQDEVVREVAGLAVVGLWSLLVPSPPEIVVGAD